MDAHDDSHIDEAAAEPPVFAGRDEALARLYRHLSDTSSRQAIVFVGRRRIGKTALLRYVLETAGSALIPVYIPLRQVSLESERAWLHALRTALADAISARHFEMLHPPPEPEPGDDLRVWLADRYLPEVYPTIRPQRQLVLLLDDAEQLNAAIQDSRLPDDMLDFLHGLINRQLNIALTLDLQAEQQLGQMQPLVEPRAAYRLGCLTNAESTAVINALIDPAGISAEGLVAVQQTTGGEPALLQITGQELACRAQANPPRQTLTADDVKAVKPAVYAASETTFQLLWKLLNRDERLVLTALGSLLYDDPLRSIDTAAIEAWLVETDYPLDRTAINAAVRGLEYNEIVEGAAAHVTINAGLFQRWLLENARLGGDQASASPRGRSSRPSRLVVGLVIAIIVVIVLVLSSLNLNNNGDEGGSQSPMPTVTLAPGD